MFSHCVCVCVIRVYALCLQLGWSQALGPWKQLPLNLFVMWMAGNSISLFPIMMVGMMCVRPVQALMGIKDGEWCSLVDLCVEGVRRYSGH